MLVVFLGNCSKHVLRLSIGTEVQLKTELKGNVLYGWWMPALEKA
jgi:hypothetical protein